MGEDQMKNEDKDILDILGIINKFFGSEYSYQIKSIEPKEYLEYKVKQDEKYPEFHDKLKNILEKSEIFGTVKQYETKTTAEFLTPIMKFSGDIINDKDYQDYCLDNLKFLAEHKDYMVKKNPFYDNLLFFNIEPILSDFFNQLPDCYKILEIYSSHLEDTLPIDSIFKSLSFIIEEKKIIQKMFFESPLSDLMDYHKWIFFDKIKESQNGEFEIYFNDWALKNSQVIETYIKAIFTLLVMLKLLNNDTSIEDIKVIIQEYDSLGKILFYLDPHNKFGNISRLRIYRNASFHNRVKIIHEGLNNRKMIFRDKTGEIAENLDQFITNFVKILLFIATINYLLSQIEFKHENNGKNIFELNYEYAKKHGMVEFWSQATKFSKELKKK